MATTDIKNLENLVKEVLEKVNGIDTQKLDETASEELVKKVEALNKKFDKKSKDFIKEIRDEFEKYQSVNDEILSNSDPAISNSIKDFVSIITNEMTELKEQFEKFSTEYTDISLNTSMAASKEILSLKNCVFALNDTIDAIKEKVETYNFKEELTPPISENVTNSVTETLSAYFTEFKKEIFKLLAKISDGINNIIENQKAFEGIEISLGEIIQTQHKNKDEILKIISTNIADENKKLLPKILQMINGVTFDDAAEEIKDGLYAVNENLGIVNKNIETSSIASEKILEKVNDINNNVNETKDNLQELVKTEFNEAINNLGGKIDDMAISVPMSDMSNVLTKIDSTVDNLSKNISKSELIEKISKIDSTVDNLSEDISKSELIEKISKIDSVLESVSSEFNVITKGSRLDTGDYVYTLLDLESDISKVRVVLNELNNTINDDRSLAESVTKNLSDKIAKVNSFIEKTAKLYADTDYKSLLVQFDALNDDITSISKRTNKLILTSDDSAMKLQKNIENFQNIMKKINTSVENFEKSSIIKALADRTACLQKFMKASIQSDNAINEAFMYLAGWIDNTTIEIENIQHSLSEIKEKSYETEFNGIRKMLKSTNELIISAGEQDIETIKNTIIKSNENLINTIEHADASETSNEVEKLLYDTNKKLLENSKRMDSIEEKVEILLTRLQNTDTNTKRLAKIETQLQQLLSYVEEED